MMLNGAEGVVTEEIDRFVVPLFATVIILSEEVPAETLPKLR
jgi:hypothetical protein